jgi:hypothetical protein
MNMTTTESTNKKSKPDPSRITLDKIAEMLGLPSWEEINELNLDHYAEVASQTAKAMHEIEEDCDASCADGDDEVYLEAERKAEDEVFSSYHSAVMHAAETFFGYVGLALEPIMPKRAPVGAKTWDFKVVPTTSWIHAANQMRLLVNGVGYLTCDTLKEFLEVNAGTPRQVALAHLGYLSRYAEVYGARSARQVYEGAWS